MGLGAASPESWFSRHGTVAWYCMSTGQHPYIYIYIYMYIIFYIRMWWYEREIEKYTFRKPCGNMRKCGCERQTICRLKWNATWTMSGRRWTSTQHSMRWKRCLIIRLRDGVREGCFYIHLCIQMDAADHGGGPLAPGPPGCTCIRCMYIYMYR